MITDPDEAATRMVRLVTEGRLETIDGQELRLDVESICIHSDTPTAAAIATTIRRQFAAAGITVRALRER